MITFVYVCLSLIAAAFVVAVVWRFASHRQSLPCPVWLRWLVELDNPFTRTNRASVIIADLDLEPGMKVVDAGCGPGRLTIPIAEKIGPEGQVVAVDIQSGMLQRVQEKARAAKITNIRFVQAGVGEGKLEHGQYDRALLVTVLGEIPDQKAALRELFEVLKPGGILSVTEVIFDPHFQSRDTVLRLASQAGFQERNFFGKRLAYTMHFEKPSNG